MKAALLAHDGLNVLDRLDDVMGGGGHVFAGNRINAPALRGNDLTPVGRS